MSLVNNDLTHQNKNTHFTAWVGKKASKTSFLSEHSEVGFVGDKTATIFCRNGLFASLNTPLLAAGMMRN